MRSNKPMSRGSLSIFLAIAVVALFAIAVARNGVIPEGSVNGSGGDRSGVFLKSFSLHNDTNWIPFGREGLSLEPGGEAGADGAQRRRLGEEDLGEGGDEVGR